MEKKETAVESPIVFDGHTIVPVVETSISYSIGKHRISFFVSKKPVFLLVFSTSMRKAFRISGEEISLELAVKEAPYLEKFL